jgi:hypothetical protein
LVDNWDVNSVEPTDLMTVFPPAAGKVYSRAVELVDYLDSLMVVL